MSVGMIGGTDRRSAEMARKRRRPGDWLIPVPRPVEGRRPLPLVQRQPADESGAGSETGAPAAASVGAPEELAERVQNTVSPQAVADRVYQLLRRDLVRGRERLGGR